jgi:tetrapyrrole methylase family protein/MazG family protein
MLMRVVGLGPGDPDLLTLGSREALRRVGRAITVLAPPELVLFLESEGVKILRDRVAHPALFMRGSSEAIESFVAALDDQDLALAILGNPLTDFAGLPVLLRALERRGWTSELVPGMPRGTLSAAVNMSLVPLPPLSEHHSWDDVVEIMARLRRSYPWDREQTHQTLLPYLIEETFEVVDAVEARDDNELREELGDILLQVLFHAQLATERGKFSIADVVDTLSNKMIRRHPHVFGDQAVSDVSEVWRNWDELKALEPAGKKRTSRLDGVPKGLGSLQRAQKMQEKAARIGFDWPDLAGIHAKVAEELSELEGARRDNDPLKIREEMGDVLFTFVNLSRAIGVDAEGALRAANDKFFRRFAYMERRAENEGRDLADLSLDELEELWQLAKTQAA